MFRVFDTLQHNSASDQILDTAKTHQTYLINAIRTKPLLRRGTKAVSIRTQFSGLHCGSLGEGCCAAVAHVPSTASPLGVLFG